MIFGHIRNCKKWNLVKKFREIDLFNFTSFLGLDFFKFSGLLYKVKNLPNSKDPLTPLHIAATFGNLEMCKYILDRTEAKNLSLSVIGTPLHGAARNGHLEVCKLIMENVKDNNADRNPSNEFGNTPLHFAARHSTLKLEKK